MSDYRDANRNFSPIEFNVHSNLAGSQAYKLLYTYQDDKGTSWQAMEIGTMVSNKVYYIKYDTEPRQFAMDMPIVQNITESFRIGIH